MHAELHGEGYADWHENQSNHCPHWRGERQHGDGPESAGEGRQQQRLGQPRPDVLLSPDAGRAQHVDRCVDLAGLDQEIWQCPVVLLADVRSVGVQGDGRSYGHPIVLRPVSSEDAMTADWSRLPYDVLAKISNRITNEVEGVNRVVLDVTSKPPGTIEWE